jgi:uncharacterized membrane protein
VTGVPPEVTVYLAAVRAALADLPEEERDDLLSDVRASLVEAAAESGGNVAARLGPPEEFAAELRAAAGLHPPAPVRRDRRIVDAVRRIAADPQLRRLLPIWWVTRAYVAVGAIALLLGASWSIRYAVVPHVGSGIGGLLTILAAVLVSVWLGLRTRSRLLVELALVAAAVPLLVHLSHPSPPRPEVVYFFATPSAYLPGLSYDGAPIDNIYPYSRDGHLLHDVLLYNGSGTPLQFQTGVPDPQRRVVRTPAGKPVFNAFPIRYYEPGTKQVAHPDASPTVTIPKLATPPLRRR